VLRQVRHFGGLSVGEFHRRRDACGGSVGYGSQWIVLPAGKGGGHYTGLQKATHSQRKDRTAERALFGR
jgi:hypothetical protein